MAESNAPAAAKEPDRTYDPRKFVLARDKKTKEVLPHKVPETHLDGRFPNLEAVPSTKKEGK